MAANKDLQQLVKEGVIAQNVAENPFILTLSEIIEIARNGIRRLLEKMSKRSRD